VVAEQDPARRGDEVPAVGQSLRGRSAAVIHTEHPDSEKTAVEAVGEEVGADSREDNPGGVDGLSPVEGQDCPGPSSHQGDHQPSQSFHEHG
jgi:hypothetical protein